MALHNIGYLVSLCSYIYDALAFANEWMIFLTLLVSLLNAILLIYQNIFKWLLAVAVLFAWKILKSIFDCLSFGCYDEYDGFLFGGIFLWDCVVFAIDNSLWVLIVLTIYVLVKLVRENFTSAGTLWTIFFVTHLLFRAMYGHHNYVDDRHRS